MSNSLEIALTEAEGTNVSLNSMSKSAIESFVSAVSSLKSLAVSVAEEETLNFSISEGSAMCTVNAPQQSLDAIHLAIETAIGGKSEDKSVTSHLRNIQTQIKRENFKFRFLYKKNNEVVLDIYEPLLKAKKIALKRSKKRFQYKLLLVSGLLNQIGGKNPNYHFDYGDGNKLTIACSQEEAIDVNQHLYKKVQSLLICKEWYEIDRKDEYYHKIIVKEEHNQPLRAFLKKYNNEKNLIEKLSLIHDFIDSCFEKDYGHDILKYFVTAFNSPFFELSELKTLLVISKPFKEHPLIKDSREKLLETYLTKKSNA